MYLIPTPCRFYYTKLKHYSKTKMLNTYMTISMKTLYFCAIFAVESEKEINVKMMDEITFITDL